MKADFSIQTPSKNYPVYVRNSLIEDEFNQMFDEFATNDPFLIIDENVERIHGVQLRDVLGNKLAEGRIYIVPAGEKSKSYEQWKQIVDFLLMNGARRNSFVLAVGGGVTGDLAGFAASSTHRGLQLIHVPTTLLAMVDSSIGGKTGINHVHGKNLIGSFFQPETIFINTGFLSSLPRTEWINGLSEILKYAAIRENTIFETCEILFLKGEIKYDDLKLIELIRKCAKIKADIVTLDEKEKGLRMILNFGHTFAHALENVGGYDTISHGEAVYIGMIAACKLSNELGASLNLEVIEKFQPLYQLNQEIFSWPVDELVGAMYRDKKRSSESLKLVALQDWKQPYVTELRETAPVEDAWRYAFDLLSPSK